MLNHNVYSHVDSCLHLVFTCLCPVPKCIDLYWYVYYLVSILDTRAWGFILFFQISCLGNDQRRRMVSFNSFMFEEVRQTC